MSKLENFKIIFEHIGQFDKILFTSPRPSEISEKKRSKNVKNSFPFALQFFSLISDGLGGVYCMNKVTKGTSFFIKAPG